MCLFKYICVGRYFYMGCVFSIRSILFMGLVRLGFMWYDLWYVGV